MNAPRPLLALRCLAFSLLLLAPPSATAALESASLVPGADDGLLTVDTAAGLEWLDLTLTDGWSVDQASASHFVTGAGFRIATAAEVDRLFESAGIPPGDIDPAASGIQNLFYIGLPGLPGVRPEVIDVYRELKDKLGETAVILDRFGYSASCGLFVAGPGSPQVGFARASRTSLEVTTSYNVVYHADWIPAGRSVADPDHGVFLVRDAGLATCVVPATHLGRFNTFGLNAVDAAEGANVVGALGALGGPAPGVESRGFLSFKVEEPGVVVQAAILRLGIESYQSLHQQPDPETLTCPLVSRPSELYYLTAVDTPLPDLLRPYPGEGSAPGIPRNAAGQVVFADLGKGFGERAYAQFDVTAGDAGGFIDIPLGTQAVTALNAAIADGVPFVVGLDYSGSAAGAVFFCPAERIDIHLQRPAASHQLILTKTRAPEPFCNLELAQDLVGPGAPVVLSRIRVGARGNGPVEIDLKLWMRAPDGSKTELVSACRTTVIGGTSQDWGPAWLFSVDEQTQRGEYHVGCRMLCPVDGSILAEEILPFTVGAGTE